MAEDGDGVLDSGLVVVDISSDEEGDVAGNVGGDDGDVVIVSVKAGSPGKVFKGSAGFCGDDEDECEILDGDPDGEKYDVKDSKSGGDELLVVGEKGQVACRDYPHSRHVCVKFPFSSTRPEKHCNLCHCYVCDIPAPCVYWVSDGFNKGHCHATDNKEEMWSHKRKSFKLGISSQQLNIKPINASIRLNHVPPVICPAPKPAQIRTYMRMRGTQRTPFRGYGSRSVFKPNILPRCPRPNTLPQMTHPKQMVPQVQRFVPCSYRTQINHGYKSATTSARPFVSQMNGSINGSFNAGEPQISTYDANSQWHSLLMQLDLELEAFSDIPNQNNDGFTNVLPASCTQANPLTDVDNIACEFQPQPQPQAQPEAFEQSSFEPNLDGASYIPENLLAHSPSAAGQSMVDQAYGRTNMASEATSVLSAYNISSEIAGPACPDSFSACPGSPFESTVVDSSWTYSLPYDPGLGLSTSYTQSSPYYDGYDKLWNHND